MKRKKKFYKYYADQIRRMYKEQDLTMREIAAMIGCAASTVWFILHNYNYKDYTWVPIRKPDKARPGRKRVRRWYKKPVGEATNQEIDTGEKQ